MVVSTVIERIASVVVVEEDNILKASPFSLLIVINKGYLAIIFSIKAVASSRLPSKYIVALVLAIKEVTVPV